MILTLLSSVIFPTYKSIYLSVHVSLPCWAAGCYNLDLNLWVSPTTNGTYQNHVQNAYVGSKKRQKAKSPSFNFQVGGLAAGGQLHHDPTPTNQQIAVRPSMYSSHTPNYEVNLSIVHQP